MSKDEIQFIKTSRDQKSSHTRTKYLLDQMLHKKQCANINDPSMQKTLHYEDFHNLDNKQQKTKSTFTAEPQTMTEQKHINNLSSKQKKNSSEEKNIDGNYT